MGVTITDVKIVHACEKHRKISKLPVPTYKDGSPVAEKDRYCFWCNF